MVLLSGVHAETLRALDASGVRSTAGRTEAARFVETGDGVAVDVGTAALLALGGILTETGNRGGDTTSLVRAGGREGHDLLTAVVVVFLGLRSEESLDVHPVGAGEGGGDGRHRVTTVVQDVPSVLAEPLHHGAELFIGGGGGVVDVGDHLRDTRKSGLEVGLRGDGAGNGGGEGDVVILAEVGPTEGTGEHLGDDVGEEGHNGGRRVGRNRALTITDSEEIANGRGRKGGTVRNAAVGRHFSGRVITVSSLNCRSPCWLHPAGSGPSTFFRRSEVGTS